VIFIETPPVLPLIGWLVYVRILSSGIYLNDQLFYHYLVDLFMGGFCPVKFIETAPCSTIGQLTCLCEVSVLRNLLKRPPVPPLVGWHVYVRFLFCGIYWNAPLFFHWSVDLFMGGFCPVKFIETAPCSTSGQLTCLYEVSVLWNLLKRPLF